MWQTLSMVLQTQSCNNYNAIQKVESTCSGRVELPIDIVQNFWIMMEWLTLVLKNNKNSNKRKRLPLSTQATIRLNLTMSFHVGRSPTKF